MNMWRDMRHRFLNKYDAGNSPHKPTCEYLTLKVHFFRLLVIIVLFLGSGWICTGIDNGTEYVRFSLAMLDLVVDTAKELRGKGHAPIDWFYVAGAKRLMKIFLSFHRKLLPGGSGNPCSCLQFLSTAPSNNLLVARNYKRRKMRSQ